MSSTPDPTSITPQPSFLQATRDFLELLFQAESLAEAKVQGFIFLSTACYMEFDTPKKITIDEFLHGRKRKDGTRINTGCGLKTRHGVINGLRLGVAGMRIKEETDDKDAARILKKYGLNLPTRQECTPCTSDSAVTELSQSASSAHHAPLECTVSTSGVHAVHLDQSKYSSKYLEEVPNAPPPTDEATLTSLAADAALEIIPDSEEENLKREIDALKAEEAAFPTLLSPERRQEKMQIGMLRMRLQDRLRSLQETPLSGSQAPDNASPGAGLQEANEEDDDAQQFTLEELRDTLDGLQDAYSETYHQRQSARGTPEYDRLSAALTTLRLHQNRVRAAIRKLEPPEDDAPPPITLFGDEEPAPVMVAPKTNFTAAAIALDIPLNNRERTAEQQSIVSAIAAWLNKRHIEASVALEALRLMVKENATWLKDATVGGYLSLLPRYVSSGGAA